MTSGNVLDRLVREGKLKRQKADLENENPQLNLFKEV